MRCEESAELVWSILDQGAGGPLLGEHLAACPACRDYAARADRAHSAMKALAAEAPSRSLERAVAARLEAMSTPGLLGGPWDAAAVGAGLAALAGAAVAWMGLDASLTFVSIFVLGGWDLAPGTGYWLSRLESVRAGWMELEGMAGVVPASAALWAAAAAVAAWAGAHRALLGGNEYGEQR